MRAEGRNGVGPAQAAPTPAPASKQLLFCRRPRAQGQTRQVPGNEALLQQLAVVGAGAGAGVAAAGEHAGDAWFRLVLQVGGWLRTCASSRESPALSCRLAARPCFAVCSLRMPSERVKRQQQKKRQRVQRMPRALQRARWATLAAPLQVAPPATEAAVRAALQALQAQLRGSAAGSSAEQAGGRAGLPPAAATRSWPLGGPQQAPAAAGAGPTGGSAGRGRPQRASSKRVAEVVAQERQAEVLDLTGWDSEEEEEAEGGSTEDEEQQASQSSGGHRLAVSRVARCSGQGKSS